MRALLLILLLIPSISHAQFWGPNSSSGGSSGGGVSGVAAGNIPQGSSSTTLTTSNIYQVGSNIGIGSTAPGTLLDVPGAFRATTINGLTFSAGTGSGTNLVTSTGSTVNGDCGIWSNGNWIDSGSACPTTLLSGLTTNYVPLASSSSTIGNSTISQVSGNVGIGSAAPGYPMDVQGSIRATGFVGNGAGLTGISGSISGLTTNKIPKAASSTTIADGIITDNGTNIGIGSAVPTQKLDVVGTINASTGVTVAGSGSGKLASLNNIQLDPSHTTFTTPVQTWVGSNTGIGTVTAGKLLTVGSTGQATVDSSGNIITSGNIGIGTAIAPQALYIVGNVAMTGTCTAGGSSCGGGGSSQWNTVGSTINYVAGNVGIGSAVPGQVLDVYGAGANIRVVASSGDSVFNATNGANVGIFDTQSTGNLLIDNKSNNGISLATNDTTRMVITNAGNIGIGSATPSNVLEMRSTSSGLTAANLVSTTGTMGYYADSPNTKTPFFTLRNAGSDVGGMIASRASSPPFSSSTAGDIGFGTPSGSTGNVFIYSNGSGSQGVKVNSSGHITVGASASHVSTGMCWDASGFAGYCSGGLAASCGTCTAL